MSKKALSERMSDSVHNPAIISIKSNFGKTLSELSIKDVMSFMSLGFGTDNAIFLVSGLFFNVNKSGKISSATVPFEKKLATYYGISSQTTRKKIEDLINTEFDEEGVFASKFKRICKQMIAKEEINLSNVDFDKLYQDIKFWNYEGNYVKLRWAKAIFSVDEAEKEE